MLSAFILSIPDWLKVRTARMKASVPQGARLTTILPRSADGSVQVCFGPAQEETAMSRDRFPPRSELRQESVPATRAWLDPLLAPQQSL